MKFIIRQILIAFALIAIINEAQCKQDIQKLRLSHVFENIIKEKTKDYNKERDNEISRAYDMDCVKNFFNLPQNNKMIVTEIDEIIFKVGAGVKCSDEDKVFESILDSHVDKGMRKYIYCLTWHLNQLEPTSKLTENFTANEDDINKCKTSIPIEDFEELQTGVEQMLGPLNAYTCGTVSENGGHDFLKFMAKGAIARYGNISEELKKTVMEDLKEYFREVSTTTVSCSIKRYENDPKGYHIEDTLNYFFKKDMEPIDLEGRKPNSYLKNLAKVESSIDANCVNEKLNLPENGDKNLLEIEATILIALAKSKCIKGDQFEFAKLFMNLLVINKSMRQAECAKHRLHKLEPTSKFAKNAISDEEYEKNCFYYDMSIHPLHTYESLYKDSVGRLNETTCGLLTKEIVDVIEFKTYLLANEVNEEVKKSEIQEFFTTTTEKLEKLADCVLERIK